MLQKTPLNAVHRALGARMVEFGGWDMPVQYRGVIDEHLAVRGAAGLFDVSHMGEIDVRGPGALAYLQELTINDVSRLVDGQVQYNAMCYPHGGTVDDITLYRFSPEHYFLCVNASNTDKDFAWMEQVLADGDFPGVKVHNVSVDYAQLALQGPAAAAILAPLCSQPLNSIGYYHFAEGLVAGTPALISRTGYTGEDGFELYFEPAAAESVWAALMEAGAGDGLAPIGLGARDTLRLEKKFALYGHELSESISPLEAGLGWITRLEKPSFVGREALLRQKSGGIPRRLIGLSMSEPGIPRADYPVFCNGEEVGVVTSGTMSPSLRLGIALALVRGNTATAVGTPLEIGIRGRRVKAVVAKTPFVTK
ncbi:MAG TPA: glycine cleavage system aminomethyltransferase GcvT [Desulfuromonas sp.]|nr:glycine cleavage system aminomethyltransferase GcvT [Desulfuromonas sp.]